MKNETLLILVLVIPLMGCATPAVNDSAGTDDTAPYTEVVEAPSDEMFPAASGEALDGEEAAGAAAESEAGAAAGVLESEEAGMGWLFYGYLTAGILLLLYLIVLIRRKLRDRSAPVRLR